MPESEPDHLLPLKSEDPISDYADVLALYASVIPVVGGAVSNVLTGWSAERKHQRVVEVLTGLSERIQGLRNQVKEEYVRSEEFEDLLDQTLRRVGNERHSEKRRLYREFLVGAITSGQPYDEQLRHLRLLDELQVAHIQVIRAMLVKPQPPQHSGGIGSFRQTLKKRLPGLSEESIEHFIEHLNDLRVTKVPSLKTVMTEHGAQDMRSLFAPLGNSLVKYILAAET